MKVFVITEDTGYGGARDVVKAVRTTPEAVTAWLISKCDKEGCILRHDQWNQFDNAPKHPSLNPEVVCDDSVRNEWRRAYDEWRRAYDEWREQFCLSSAWDYDIEEWDTDAD